MGLTPVTNIWRQFARRVQLLWWQWAAREIPPLHPDVPLVVRRIDELRRTR